MGLEELLAREEELKNEIKEFEKEKELVKQMIGNIGGKSFSKKDSMINFIFLGGILLLFVIELSTHILPAFISLEIGVLLVSVKIVWMIHSQQKVYHFQFWMLNSIEFRINQLLVRIKKLDKKISTLQNQIEAQNQNTEN